MLAPSPISAHAMQELAAVAVTRDFRTESCRVHVEREVTQQLTVVLNT